MTGGYVLNMGETGRNFAAGMSGGIAYLYDPDKSIRKTKINLDSVDIESLELEDRSRAYGLLHEHRETTSSELAGEIMSDWENEIGNFIKIMPREYKIALERIKKESLVWEK